MANNKRNIIETICNQFKQFDNHNHYFSWRGCTIYIPELSSIFEGGNGIQFNGYEESKRLYLRIVNINIDKCNFLNQSVVTTYDKMTDEQKGLFETLCSSLTPVANEYTAGFYWHTMRSTGK